MRELEGRVNGWHKVKDEEVNRTDEKERDIEMREKRKTKGKSR